MGPGEDDPPEVVDAVSDVDEGDDEAGIPELIEVSSDDDDSDDEDYEEDGDNEVATGPASDLEPQLDDSEGDEERKEERTGAATTQHVINQLCSGIDFADEDEETPRERKTRLAREGRQEQALVRAIVRDAQVDSLMADDLVARLLKTRAGRAQVPMCAQILAAAEVQALAPMRTMAARLPSRSRFRRTIAQSAATSQLERPQQRAVEAMGLSEAYLRVMEHRERRNGASNPLFDEAIRGFPGVARESCPQVEKDVIITWARTEMVVRSGCHNELFRLNDRKLKVYENFQAAYLRLLREVHRRDSTLEGSLMSNKPLTILQRNIRRAQWLAAEPNFEEGKAADEQERSRLRRRVAEQWQRGRIDPDVIAATFDPTLWVNAVHRGYAWFWTTLKEEGLRFRRDYTPYQCGICIQHVDKELDMATTALVNLRSAAGRLEEPDADLNRQIQVQDGTVRRLAVKARNLASHKKQVALQRVYNQNGGPVDDWLRGSSRRVRVTTDFGASYFLEGDNRYVNLIFFLKYLNEYGEFSTETLYCTVSDPDERSEDAFFTRTCWHHLLRGDGRGAGVFDNFDEIKLLRDSGPHFQNNKICFFETTIFEEYGKKFTVSAFAKRHGWNECDGAMARYVRAMKEASLEGSPPETAGDAVAVINHHEKFANCTAYHFQKIDRDPAIFPKYRDFRGIQKLALCEFVYEWTDFDGTKVSEPGWVLARHCSGCGPWYFHDFLPHTRPEEWGKRCASCSNTQGRAVYHTRDGEPLKTCRNAVHREIVQPDPSEVDAAAQPVPISQRHLGDMGPDAVVCNLCPPGSRQYKPNGIRRHHNATHGEEVPMSFSRVHPLPAAPPDQDAAPPAPPASPASPAPPAPAQGRLRRSRRQSAVVQPAKAAQPARAAQPAQATSKKRARAPAPTSPKKKAKKKKKKDETSSDEEASSEDSDGGDFGVNHAGLEIFELDRIIDERGDGVNKEYRAYWKPRSRYPTATWHVAANFVGCEAAIKAFHTSK